MAHVSVLAPFILSWEGGFSNHPNDNGGATNHGVTLATWKAQGYDKNGDGVIDVEDIKLLTERDATDVVLKPHFWDRCKADEIASQSVANIFVDWVWGSGANGIKGVQKVLRVTVDGIVGSQTLAAINAANARLLFANIKKARIAYLQKLVKRKPAQEVFLKGWMRRLNAINYGSLTLNKTGKNNVTTFNDV